MNARPYYNEHVSITCHIDVYKAPKCQNFSLIANWNSRGVPLPVGEVPLTVVVIRPKLALEKLPFGLPYCARLKMLKPSMRSTATKRSVMRKSRDAAASACQKSGPRTRLRPASPQVSGAGMENAAALIQLLIVWFTGT